MTTLFPISQAERAQTHEVELELLIEAKTHYFAGHFPRDPVLPGVAQVHWAVQYCKRYFPQLHAVVAVEALKFHAMIRPEQLVTLVLQQTADSTVLFSYQQGELRFSSGRLKWSLAANA